MKLLPLIITCSALCPLLSYADIDETPNHFGETPLAANEFLKTDLKFSTALPTLNVDITSGDTLTANEAKVTVATLKASITPGGYTGFRVCYTPSAWSFAMPGETKKNFRITKDATARATSSDGESCDDVTVANPVILTMETSDSTVGPGGYTLSGSMTLYYK